jgi:hypothetical protein
MQDTYIRAVGSNAVHWKVKVMSVSKSRCSGEVLKTFVHPILKWYKGQSFSVSYFGLLNLTDFLHYVLFQKNITFRRSVLFPSSGEKMVSHLICWVR